MGKYTQQNVRVIQNAFSRLVRRKDSSIKAGLIEMAKAGLEYLAEAHDFHGVMMHTHEENTMCYVVAHNGTVIVAEPFEGGDYDLPGNAVNEATAIISGTNGWVAMIYSNMEGWYRTDYEIEFMEYSRDEIVDNFHNYFKKV